MSTSPTLLLRITLAATLAVGLLASEAAATWSIVVVNRRTREVGIASATCVTGSRLRVITPVVRVGLGAGAAQAFVGPGANRLRIWDGLIAHETPQEILDALAAQDAGHQSRQYGIVDFFGPPVTFSGANTGAGRCGVAGEVGDLAYAIQGNVITGDPVCLDAEAALLGTEGDLGQKLMAAMEAARRRGGDGRCSCTPAAPDSCGAPPDDFTKTAHVGFVLLARVGDPDDETCPTGFGCALPPAPGEYYLALEHTGSILDPDPVHVMQAAYEVWRAGKAGIADQVGSEVASSAQRLVADGVTAATITIRLNDVEGLPVSGAGLVVDVTRTAGDPIATIGPVTHVGGNVFEFELTATQVTGRGQYDVVVSDSATSVQLYPPVFLDSAPLAPMHSTLWDLSAIEGGGAGLVLNLGSAQAGAPYHVFGSFSGTHPGTPVGGTTLPLNRDRLFDLTELNPGYPALAGFVGVTDANGRAEAAITFAPMALLPLVGTRLEFAALVGSAGATNPAGFVVVP